ncbi:MAG: hypothetical protein ACO398_02510, partial [Kiritimatiellia bacterium]
KHWNFSDRKLPMIGTFATHSTQRPTFKGREPILGLEGLSTIPALQFSQSPLIQNPQSKI